MLINFHSLQVAVEVNIGHNATVDVPDAFNVEVLSVGSLNGIGVGISASGHQNHVSLASDLVDYDAAAVRLFFGLVDAEVLHLEVLNSMDCLRQGGFDKVCEHSVLFI